MKKILPLLAIMLVLTTAAKSQKVVDRLVDNKGTIRWVLDSTTAVITRGDSTMLFVTPSQMNDSLTNYVRNSDTATMLSHYINDAGNGLTKQGQKVSLGGALSQQTTIQTTAANFLAITGLQSGNTTDSVMVVDPTTGQLKFLSASSLFSSLTANNGLTKTGNNIQLGGSLNQATTITTSATNTLAIQGLQSGTLATDSIVVADATTGALKQVSAASLLQSGNQSYTATAGQTSYSVTSLPANASRVWVFRNGAKLVAGTDYTSSAGSVTLTPTNTPPNDWAVVSGDIIEIQWVK